MRFQMQLEQEDLDRLETLALEEHRLIREEAAYLLHIIIAERWAQRSTDHTPGEAAA